METMGNIIAKSYQFMAGIKLEDVLVLGDTNFCLLVIGAKRLHIPIFHMEAENCCKDEFEYIEAFYNTKRIHSHCGFMSPNDFEKLYE